MTQNSVNNSASDFTVDNLFLDGNTLSSTDTNGNIILAPDGIGEVSVTTAPIVPSGDRADSLGSATNSWDNVYADGLTFDDGTNILSTYVAATSWTPTLTFGGGTTGITYTNQSGSYTRIGNIAFVSMVIQLSNKGTDTGNAIITGFPLTSYGQSQDINVGMWNLVTFTSTRNQLVYNVPASSSNIQLFQCGENINFLSTTDANYADTSQIRGTFFLNVV